MAEWSKIDYLLAQTDDEVLHVGKDGTRYNGGTWSPWIGCDKGDRPGCDHCWAEMWARRNPRFRGHWGKNAPRYFFPETHWKQPLIWNAKCDDLGMRKRVLVSLCDPFERPLGSRGEPMDEARLRLFRLIRQTPNLDWLLLTKRSGNLQQWVGSDPKCAPGNLWLGVSCWDQPSADRNIPPLLEVPAALHWVSLEPLLGQVSTDIRVGRCHVCGTDIVRDLLAGTEFCGCCLEGPEPLACGGLDWVVVGCESRGARPGRRCDREWVHSLAGQCRRAKVPLFTKQLPDALSGRQLVKSTQLAAEGWPVQMPRRAT